MWLILTNLFSNRTLNMLWKDKWQVFDIELYICPGRNGFHKALIRLVYPYIYWTQNKWLFSIICFHPWGFSERLCAAFTWQKETTTPTIGELIWGWSLSHMRYYIRCFVLILNGHDSVAKIVFDKCLSMLSLFHTKCKVLPYRIFSKLCIDGITVVYNWLLK